jgi:hypothetical protein
MTTIYQSDPLNKAYIGSRDATSHDYDLVKKDMVLTGRMTTLIAPPETAENQVAVLISKDTWAIVDDYRGYIGYDAAGVKQTITEINVVPDPSWTVEKPFILANAKAKKIAEIDTQTRAAITAGFKSSALGAEYLYQSEVEDQLNLSGVTASGSDWPFKCSPDDGATWAYLAHTAAQLQQVTNDGINHKLTQLQAGGIRKAQVDALVEGAIQADLDAI